MTSRFSGADDTELVIGNCDESSERVHLWAPPGTCLAPEKLPAIVAALYAAAGKPEPVILERPRETSLRGASVWFAGAFFNVREDGQIEACPVSQAPVETFTPEKLRERLALLGRLADEAEATS